MNEVRKLLQSRHAGLHARIEQALVQAEADFNRRNRQAPSEFLVDHSRQTAAIAHLLAAREGVDPFLAVLVALFHDAGKFHGGGYHGDDLPEEEHAARLAEAMLVEHGLERTEVDAVTAALRALYDDRLAPASTGRIVQDADRLAKLGALGVGAFFTKATLRGRGLVDALASTLSRELTYALAAPRSMLTESGRALARRWAAASVAYFDGLLADLDECGIASFERRTLVVQGDFRNRVGDRVDAMEVTLVTPRSCPQCEASIGIEHRRERGVKCEMLRARVACSACGHARDIAFCLPVFA
jgi:HD superfamily phosphodiesterase